MSGWSSAGLGARVATFENLLDAGLVRAGGRALDVGCGAGTYVRLLAKRGVNAIGVDYSGPTLQRARERDPGALGAYLSAEAALLPFSAGMFDVVLCIGVLQTVDDVSPVLSELARVLAPGGALLLEMLNRWSPPALMMRALERLEGRPSLLRRHAPATIERLLRHRGLTPIERIAIVVTPSSVDGGPGRSAVAAAMRLAALGRMGHAVWIVGRKAG